MELYVPLQAGQKMNKFSVLTNTSVNKNYQPEYLSIPTGSDCKMPLGDALGDIAEAGLDRDRLWSDVERLVILTLVAIQVFALAAVD